jgi:glucose-1-phosphate thymidylyltransferase
MINRKANTSDVVGLIPAAGDATRIPGLPFSKALYPVPDRAGDAPAIQTPIGRLLTAMETAGARRAIVVSRHGRHDLADYVGSGFDFGLPVAHLPIPPTPSVPHTLCAAKAFVKDAHVLFGLPDILFDPPDSLRRILSVELESSADVVLGLLPMDRLDKSDRVEVDDRRQVVRIDVKSHSSSGYAWIFAAWSPVFSDFLADYVAAAERRNRANEGELQLAEIFVAARSSGLTVLGETIRQGRFLDIGSPDALARVARFVED